ncbi:MAG: hypothetical protein Q4C70_05000 [Planctomycetia bacterium]|nr:hypothetical protein [Planctomycetia bacterium]
MRSTEDLLNFAEQYARENDSPFIIPSEFDLEFVPDTTFVDTVHELIAAGAKEPAGGCDCAAERTAPPAVLEQEKNAVAPADNMGPVKYHFPRNWGGYDGGCEASVEGEWDERFAPLCQRLDVAKQAADDGDEAKSYIEFGGFVWKMRPMGAGVGWAKYKWVMESRGVKLYIHSNPKSSIPGVHVRFGFECLVKTDLFRAWEALKKSLEVEGYRVKSEIISRVDMQVLLPVDISEFVKAMTGRKIVTRCRGVYQTNSNLKTGRTETITVRSDNAELCIYDKRAQVEQADSVYYQTFSRHVLGEEMAALPENLTRVEYRFRRPFLRRYGIENFDNLKESAWALLDIASSDWFRILEREKVRGSENEIENCGLWDRVREAFNYYFHFAKDYRHPTTKKDLKEYKPFRPAPCVSRVISQGLGCLASAVSTTIDKVSRIEQVKEYVSELLDTFAEKVLDKIIDKQIVAEIVRDFTVSGKPSFACVSDIQIQKSPGFEWDFVQFEGDGWEGEDYDDSDAF